MKYGVKVTIIDEIDYPEFKEVLDAIESKGYKIKLVDNGNAVCIKED